jgi:alginate O-acetyltransferase complex protein AlgI
LAFNSINYLLFFSVVSFIYYLLPLRYRWIWIILSSIFFYISSIPIFIVLLSFLIIVNYFIAIWLYSEVKKRKKRIYISGIIFNLFILAFFKYFRFFQHSSNFSSFDFKIFNIGEPLSQWIIPLGLSFFTFTVVSYLIEVKRENIQPERHIGIFSAYMLFFPKLAQGPIERPLNLLPQFRQPHDLDYNQIVEGLKQMLWGFFLKLVIADRLAIYVNTVYNNSGHHNGTTLAVATVFFAFQIYADFSGYTEIALGSAKILGFNLKNNFNRPYFSTSIKEFWSRWHITFSTWLRDYLFLPLGYFFSKKLKNDKYLTIATEKWIYLFATIITFAICGLWHGEGLNYLVWGLLFGIYLTYAKWTEKPYKRILKKLHVSKSFISYKIYKVIVIFSLVSFTWIFFRAQSFSDAISIINKILHLSGTLFIGSPGGLIYCILGIFLLLIVEFETEFKLAKIKLLRNKSIYIRFATYIFLIITIFLIGVIDGSQFIYFQF